MASELSYSTKTLVKIINRKTLDENQDGIYRYLSMYFVSPLRITIDSKITFRITLLLFDPRNSMDSDGDKSNSKRFSLRSSL